MTSEWVDFKVFESYNIFLSYVEKLQKQVELRFEKSTQKQGYMFFSDFEYYLLLVEGVTTGKQCA